jgi:hypothetical protein
MSGWRASGVRRLGEVGLGDAVGVAGRPLDQFDSITVGVGDPALVRGRSARSGSRRRIGRRQLPLRWSCAPWVRLAAAW